MAPVMMRRLPWLCWLALWVTTAKVTSATGVTQSNAEGGNGNNSSLSPADWSCPLEKWSLEERQNRSQVVFTAVIESCQTSESGSIDGETVEDDQELCQRYLMQQSQDQPIVGDPNLAINVRIKKVVKGLDRMWEGRRVRVEGLRDPRICPSRVRLRDTRIFLASYVNQPVSPTILDDDETLAPVHHQPPIDSAAPIRLRLNSSLMSVSLRHLQQLRAFTKDVPFDSRAASAASPVAVLDDKPDPCADLKCPPGAKCIATPDASSATCQCPTKCSSYGDSVGSRPICGVDGKDYANMCELHKSSCLANRMIAVKFQGSCDPCASVECLSPSVCVLDSERKPHCRCGDTCPSDFQPVCGSDGRSYSSQCHLQQEACRSQRHLRILYKGLCESGVHPCSKAGCEPDEECQVDEKGMPQCLCKGPCPPIHRPVCGSDQLTYSSNCELERESCLQKRSIKLLYEGVCGSSEACSNFQCPTSGYCVETASGQPSCHCPLCGGEWDPVCGTDGVTYTNPCRLRYESCRHNKSLSIVYKGLCNLIDDTKQADGCDKKRCDFYATCETDEMGRAECVCPKACAKMAITEVCGTDGITYRNECELKQAACRNQQFIVVASKGDCDLCKRVHCEHNARCEDGICVCPTNCPSPIEPSDPQSVGDVGICASDGRTYLTECHMQRAACDHGLVLQVLHTGPCPTPPADLILAASDYHDSSTSLSNPPHHTVARKCHCNKQGSLDGACDPVTLQCRCLAGVGGRSCDRCLSGYWGIHSIGTNANGCEPCDCHRLGSIRADCEQMTGRCVCRANVVGLKCDRCQDGQLVDKVPGGCGGNGGTGSGPDDALESESRHCSDLTCRFGAICQDLQGQAVCVCPMDCPVASSAEQTVCGSDGVSYGSECDLRLAACRKQLNVVMAYEGPCSDDIIHTSAGISPLMAAESEMAVSKATRHVQETDVALLDWGRRDIVSLSQVGSQKANEYYGFSQPVWRPTAASVHVHGYLGESCIDDSQCKLISNSGCLFGVCKCSDGFAEDSNSKSCVANVATVSGIEEFGPAKISSCSSFPCLGGGTCQPLGMESFVCVCPAERTGSLCERALSQSDEEIVPAETPAFHGQSFVELKKMKAQDKFAMEIEFKSLLTDGILLYAQQRKDFDADYISLAIIAGHVELRFNLGNGPIVLRSLQPIRLGHWHRVVAQRYRQDGWLRLDDDEDVATTSPGEHSTLDLDTNSFLGAVPSHLATARTYDRIGTGSGFVGCMRRVKLGRRSVIFRVPPEGRKVSRRGRQFDENKRRGNAIDGINKSTVSTVVKMNGITQCGENPCWKTPCANQGTCVWKTGENYTCVCRPEFTGFTCESALDLCASSPCGDGSTCVSSKNRFTCKCPPGKKGFLCDQHDGMKHEILVPEFNIVHSPTSASSYVSVARSFQVSQNLDLEVWFLSRSSDGMLAYSARDENGRGDFIWLALIGGRVQFRWDLGSGAGIVTSSERVTLFNWHRVLVSRRGKEASIRLDDGATSEGRSLGPLSELNLDIPLFIGGLRHNLTLPRDVPKLENLQGAVQRVIVNGEVFEKLMESEMEQHNVAVYRGPPCGHMPATHPSSSRIFAYPTSGKDSSSPCQNGGVCQPLLASFVCKCQSGFLGKRCEKRTDTAEITRPIKFDGKTFLKYPNQLKDVTLDLSHFSWLTTQNLWMTNNSSDELSEYTNNANTTLEGLDDVIYDVHYVYTNESGKSQRSNKFELRFRTEAENGLILWLSRGHSLQADYFALAIVHSRLELSFNLGKQSSFLSARSMVNVSDGHWHTVVVERKKRLGSIAVDGEKPIRVTADPGATILNSNGKLWIGGSSILPPGLPSPYYEAFVGCMDHAKVDRQNLDWHRHGDNAILHYCGDT
ncbi:agrin-like isoform X5 [Daphnia pulex]|uniref:agrin-like isoform X5 n=1 Tax=Daphnia pulex TaxID=6669 RepID=UPI001EDD622E|nr:agrin-like isoform X5 [Daphnia pulex]